MKSLLMTDCSKLPVVQSRVDGTVSSRMPLPQLVILGQCLHNVCTLASAHVDNVVLYKSNTLI